MYIRVKRDRLTIFVQVGASDTVHKIKRDLYDSLIFKNQEDADDSCLPSSSDPHDERQHALGTVYYNHHHGSDDGPVYDRVQSADDIALVHCRFQNEDGGHVPLAEQQQQQQQQQQQPPQQQDGGGSKTLQATRLDEFKTLVDCTVENDDILYIVLRRKDTGEFEDANLVMLHPSLDDAEEEKTLSSNVH